jgi:hypothetical protein
MRARTTPVRSLRASVLIGAFLWTLGLLPVETILITIYSAYCIPSASCTSTTPDGRHRRS